jgi:hypothetical protein
MSNSPLDCVLKNSSGRLLCRFEVGAVTDLKGGEAIYPHGERKSAHAVLVILHAMAQVSDTRE